MRHRLKCSLLAASFTSLGILSIHAAESQIAPDTKRVFDASKHPWAKFGVGTTSTVRHTVTSQEGRREFTTTAVLSAVTERDCTVTVYDGKPEAAKKLAELRYALTAPECLLDRVEEGETPAAPRVAGTETVKAAGREYACTLYEQGDETTLELAVDAEGRLIRVRNGTRKDGQWSAVATELLQRADATLSGGGKKLACAVYERQDAVLGEKTTTWRCADVPGGLARMESVSKDEEGKEVRELGEAVEWKIVQKK